MRSRTGTRRRSDDEHEDLQHLPKYDTTPYTTEAGQFPFIDIGGMFTLYSTSYHPKMLAGTVLESDRRASSTMRVTR